MYLQIYTSPVLNSSRTISEVTLNLSLDDVNIDTLQVHTLLTGILTICSLMLHIFVMIVLVVERKRFDIGDIYVFGIVVANFLVLIFHSFTIPISTLLRKWPFGDMPCALTGFVYLMGTDLRLAFLIGLSIHRYCNVRFPFTYPDKHSTIIVATMMVSTIAYITVIHIWYLLVSIVFFDITWPTCDTQRNRDTSILLAVALTVVQSINLLSGIIPFILYVFMWRKALKIKKRTSSTSTSQNPLAPNTDKYSQARQYIQDSTILKEKKALCILLVMLIAGTPTTINIYIKKHLDSETFGLESITSSLIIQYALTEVTLISPYMDLLILMSTQSKKTAIKSFLRKCRSFLKPFSLTKLFIV